MTQQINTLVQQFDTLPDSMLIDIRTACAVTTSSRSSIYRQFAAGNLTPVKIGKLTRIRIGELRKLMEI